MTKRSCFRALLVWVLRKPIRNTPKIFARAVGFCNARENTAEEFALGDQVYEYVTDSKSRNAACAHL